MQDEGSHTIMNDNISLERVEQFRYFGTHTTNPNSIQEEIKSRLKSGNACCRSVQNISSSSFVFKNIKIELWKITVLPVVFYRCKRGLAHIEEGT